MKLVNNYFVFVNGYLSKPFYLPTMDNRQTTLQILYEIVKETQHPTQYLCTPREMILHSTFDWSLIDKHLHLLQEDGFVSIKQTDSLYFSITESGVDFVQQLPAFQPT
jgi:predicted transcriptional regulator